MNHLSSLTNEQLEQCLIAEAGDERQLTARVIERLVEVIRRDWHLERGFGTVADYCVGVLGYTHDQGLRRAAAARLSLRYPIIPELIRNAEISFTILQILSPVLKTPEDLELLLAARGKTRKEVERMVVARDPKALVRSSVRPLDGEHFELRATISAEAEAALARLRDIDRHAVPDGDIGELVSKAIIERCEKVEARKFGKLKQTQNAPVHFEDKAVATRTPSREIVRIISNRDGFQCRYVAPDGTRCQSHAWLEKDHRKGWAYGGRTSVANMQLMCRAHNQFKARRAL